MTCRFPVRSALCLCVLLFGSAPAFAADKILVFAAASLKNALDDADAAYHQQGGGEVVASYAASGALAKQIENGAPADLFISADLKWMDALAHEQLVKTATNLLGNELVVVAPVSSTTTLTLGAGLDLRPALGDGRLAIGDPQSVPAGDYAQRALQKLGAWQGVEDRLARSDSVRAALTLVSRGEAPLGIVYATDAAADKGVKIIATFPEDSHPPIVYPMAEVASGRNPETAKFLSWLESPAAAPYFTKQGFKLLK
jgi:molybdate transport system substrate-binding protein